MLKIKFLMHSICLSCFLSLHPGTLLSHKTLVHAAAPHSNYTTPAEFVPVLPTEGHLKQFKSHQLVTAGKFKPVSVVYHM